MAFKPINPPSADDLLENLPWANKWARGRDDCEELRDVLFCQVYDSGIMVVTKEYKAYIHEGSSLHENLMEALEVWRQEKGETFYLRCRVNRKGKPEVGIDDEKRNHRWVYSENRYTQVSKKLEEPVEPEKSSNPLLAGRVVPGGVEKTAGRTGRPPKTS